MVGKAWHAHHLIPIKSYNGGPFLLTSDITNNTTKINIKIKNKVLAMPAAAEAITPKPNSAATIATTKNINAHLNMIGSL